MLDDENLWWQSFCLFVEHYADWLQEWEVSRANLIDERKKVHSLRSAAANIGAVRLAAAAEALEEALAGSTACSPAVAEGLRVALRHAYQRTWSVAALAWSEGQAGD